jgi:hypothetical protein
MGKGCLAGLAQPRSVHSRERVDYFLKFLWNSHRSCPPVGAVYDRGNGDTVYPPNRPALTELHDVLTRQSHGDFLSPLRSRNSAQPRLARRDAAYHSHSGEARRRVARLPGMRQAVCVSNGFRDDAFCPASQVEAVASYSGGPALRRQEARLLQKKPGFLVDGRTSSGVRNVDFPLYFSDADG